jgi:TonB family protein
MFDVYMTAQAIDPHARKRFALASTLAIAASVLALGSYVGGQRFGVRRVEAPHVDLDILLANIVAAPPLAVAPPPAPEPKPVVHQEPDERAAIAPRPAPDDDDPEDVLERPSRDGARSDGTNDGPSSDTGVPGPGPGIARPPCPIPGSCPSSIVAPTRANTDTTQASAKVPLSVVRERLRFSPDPSRAELLHTQAGARGQGGTSVVEFCIDTDGHVEDVRTRRSAGDREVDRICREALSRWRFTPLAVRGKATRTCSEMSFVVAFE